MMDVAPLHLFKFQFIFLKGTVLPCQAVSNGRCRFGSFAFADCPGGMLEVQIGVVVRSSPLHLCSIVKDNINGSIQHCVGKLN
jgi:hypothetical protein